MKFVYAIKYLAKVYHIDVMQRWMDLLFAHWDQYNADLIKRQPVNVMTTED